MDEYGVLDDENMDSDDSFEEFLARERSEVLDDNIS